LNILLGIGSFINFWNDKWCSTTPLAHIAGLFDGISIPDTVSQFWTGWDWNILLCLEQMPHLFSHIMVRANQDVLNWILDKSYHLFFECPNALYIWSWVRQIFPTSLFSNKDDLFSFIKSDGSPLDKLIKLAVITFSIWMLWCMRNYARFQDKIEVSRAISVIKDLTCLVGKSSKASMKNDMMDFSVINFLGINTLLPVRWEFPSPD